MLVSMSSQHQLSIFRCSLDFVFVFLLLIANMSPSPVLTISVSYCDDNFSIWEGFQNSTIFLADE